MSIETNNTITFVIGFAAFKLGEVFSSTPLLPANQLKTAEPEFRLQQAEVRAEQRCTKPAGERTLPGRSETYSKIGANVFQIHRGSSEPATLTRLSSAQSEALRSDKSGWLRYDGVTEINMPGAWSPRPIDIELTLACEEINDGD